MNPRRTPEFKTLCIAAASTALAACVAPTTDEAITSGEQNIEGVALVAPAAIPVGAFLCQNIPLPNVSDTVPPEVPEPLFADSSKCGSVALNWGASYDTHSLIRGYRIYQNGQFRTETQGTTELLRAGRRGYRVMNLQNNTSYTFGVSAVDIHGNESSVASFPVVSTIASTATNCTDHAPPTAPTGLSLSAVPGYCRSVSVTSNGNSVDTQSGLQHYVLYRDGLRIAETLSGSTGGERFGLVPGQTYSYWMTAVDRAGNESAPSNVVNYTVPNCSSTVASGNIDTLVLAINLPGYATPATTMGDIALSFFGREFVNQPTQVKARTLSFAPSPSPAPATGIFLSARSNSLPATGFAAAESTFEATHLTAPSILLNPPNVKGFFREVSYGRINLNNVGVHGWIQLGGSLAQYCTEFSNSGLGINCNVSKIVADARALAEAQFGLHPQTHVERTVAIINGQAQNQAGGSFVFLSGMSLGTAIHEVAHTFGIEHAASWMGRKLNAPVGIQEALLVDHFDVPFGAANLSEYGDRYNRMGSAGIYHFSTFQKELLGALDPNQVGRASGNGNYVLDQVEFPSSGVKELRIPVEPGGDTHKAPFIIAEYRNGKGYDATKDFRGNVFRGVQLRLVPERFSGVASDTIYLGELTDDNPVFEDWHRNVRYTLVSRNDDQATLNVCGISPPPVFHP